MSLQLGCPQATLLEVELRGQSTRHTAFCRLNGVFNMPDCASLISSSDGERKDQMLQRVNTCGAPTAYTTRRLSSKKPQQPMLDIMTVTFHPGRKRFTLLKKLSAHHRHPESKPPQDSHVVFTTTISNKEMLLS